MGKDVGDMEPRPLLLGLQIKNCLGCDLTTGRQVSMSRYFWIERVEDRLYKFRASGAKCYLRFPFTLSIIRNSLPEIPHNEGYHWRLGYSYYLLQCPQLNNNKNSYLYNAFDMVCFFKLGSHLGWMLFCVHPQWGCGVTEDEVEKCRVQAFLQMGIWGGFFPGFASDLNASTMFLLAALVQGLTQWQLRASHGLDVCWLENSVCWSQSPVWMEGLQ